ncbi:MAG: hypothetical protein WD941_07685 [Opitutus sp.]
MSRQPNARRPWPMKWIVLVIAVVIVPYTYLTLRYRKPGPAFQPYEDMKQRANVARLLSAGYQRIPLPAGRPAEPGTFFELASAAPAAGGLPDELGSTLIEPPLLPTAILDVSAPAMASTLRDYPIQFTCMLPDDRQQLAGADLYFKERRIVITPTFERVGGDLRSRSRESLILITVPAGTLTPGNYAITLAGTRSSRVWTIEVK